MAGERGVPEILSASTTRVLLKTQPPLPAEVFNTSQRKDETECCQIKSPPFGDIKM